MTLSDKKQYQETFNAKDETKPVLCEHVFKHKDVKEFIKKLKEELMEGFEEEEDIYHRVRFVIDKLAGDKLI